MTIAVLSQREHRPTDISAEVRKRLRELRSERGYRSAAHLAAACRKRGATWVTDNVIENLESDRRNRSVTVDELFALADVLGVTPLSLLPAMAETPIERRIANLEAVTGLIQEHQALVNDQIAALKAMAHGPHPPAS